MQKILVHIAAVHKLNFQEALGHLLEVRVLTELIKEIRTRSVVKVGIGDWTEGFGCGKIVGDTLKLKVRKAMEGYLRDPLGLAMVDGKMSVRLLEIR